MITCSRDHGDIEYCFLCNEYPCNRYRRPSEKDSFITYRNVVSDMKKAMDDGIERYQAELNKKIFFLERLIENYNDGRKKNLYCIAVNLLDTADLVDIQECIGEMDETTPQKEKIAMVASWLNKKAESKNIHLKLRKQS